MDRTRHLVFGMKFLVPPVVVLSLTGCLSAEVSPVGISLTPSDPYHFDSLEVRIDTPARGLSGQPLEDGNYNFRWYRNGELQSYSGPIVEAPEVADYETEYATTRWAINGGELWRVEVTPKDGTSLGPISAQEVWVNSPPTVEVDLLQINLEGTEVAPSGNAGWDLRLLTTLDDADEAPDIAESTARAEVTWLVDQGDGLGFVEIQAPDSSLIASGLIEKGQTWKAVVTPYTELEPGRVQPRAFGPQVVAGPIPFINQPPRVATVVDINAASGSDADGDGLKTTVSRGDRVECVHSLADDDDLSSVLSATATWYTQNGNFAVDEETTIDLTHFNTLAKGDELGCAVTPFDGVDYGAAVSTTTSLVLANAVPVIASNAVTLLSQTNADGDGDETTATEGDELLCAVDLDGVSDADNDTDITFAYEWTVNGSPAGSDATLSAGFTIGDVVVCTVTPDDDDSDALAGNQVSSPSLEVTGIPNNLPVVADATLVPDPASAGEPLECSYSYSDDDGDADVSTVSWTINGVTYTEWPWVELTQNYNQSCVVDSNGNAECWGQDSEGVISETPRDIPLKKISVGSSHHGCGITFTDEVYCWGIDDGSQFDYGQVTSVPSGKFKEVVSGRGYSCAIDLNGAIQCWGDDGEGQVSDAPEGSNFVKLEAGGDDILALDEDSNITYWGENADALAQSESIFRGAGVLIDVSKEWENVCGLSEDGEVSCWGLDVTNSPIWLYSPSTSGHQAIAVGMFHACTITSKGGIKCWGTDIYGEINDRPTDLGYVAIDVGDSASCALKDTGEVVCWGIDDGSPSDFGQVSDAPTGLGATSSFLHFGGELGDTISCEVTAEDGRGVGNTVVSPDISVDNSIPTVVDVGISPTDPGSGDDLVCEGSFSDAEGDTDHSLYEWTINGSPAEGVEWRGVSVGNDSPCALDAVGQVVCWGRIFKGEPAQLAFLGSSFIAMDSGFKNQCAIDSAGAIQCISEGGGDFAEINDNVPSSGVYTTVSVGDTAACALSEDGDLVCWGVDDSSSTDYGQVTGAPTGTFVAVSVGSYLACAIDDLGALHCWGDSGASFGTSFSMPVGTFVDVSVARDHACARTVAGGLECWGKDGQNQVTNTPTGDGFLQVETGTDRTCALDADGGITCWGRDVYKTISNAPSGDGFTALSVGQVSACAVDSDAQIVCWGIDDPGNNVDVGQVTAAPSDYNPLGETLTAEFIHSGDEISCTIIPFDGTVYGDPSSSSNVTVLNAAPVVSDVVVEPDPASASDTLSCSYRFDDIDGDADQSQIVWAVAGTNLAANSDGDNDELTLDGGYSEGDVVECFVTAHDGLVDGNTASAAVTINISPEVSNVEISPERPVEGDTLTCSYDYVDADSDADQSTISWSIDGTEVGTGTQLSGGFSAGETVKCSVTPSDGITVTGAQVGTVTINTPPSASAVQISPSVATATDTLTCSYAFSDVDQDTEGNSVIAWTVNGGDAGAGITLDSSMFVAGDSVICSVTPSDGLEFGAIVSSDVLEVENSPPSVSDVKIIATDDADGDGDDFTAGAQDKLECTYTFADVDGDNDQGTTFEWLDGDGLSFASTSARLPASETKERGDSITCVVTPSDGSATGPEGSTSITITNSRPEISSVTLESGTDDDGDSSASTATSDDALICSVAAVDADSDPLTHQFTWYVNGSALPAAASTTTNSISQIEGGMGLYVRGDQVYCDATVGDSDAVGDTRSSGKITIDNASPVVSGVAVLATTDEDGDGDPTTISGADSVECSYTFSDSDADSDQSTIGWVVSGTDAGSGSSPDTSYEDGDTITCTVTPNDGSASGAPVSAAATVGGGASSTCASVTLDGVDSWVSIPVVTFSGTDWTFEAWMDFDWTGAGGYLFHTACHAISFNPNGSLSAFEFPACNGTGVRKIATDQSVDMSALPNGWQHFAVSNSSTGAIFYVNGVQVGQASYVYGTADSVYGGGLGARTDTQVAESFVRAAFSDVRLSQAQLYTGTSFSVAPDSQLPGSIVLHYTFENQGGTAVTDRVNSNHGVMLGNATWSTTCETEDDDNDGVVAWLDCDDGDGSLGERSLDQDCDGVLTADDCDDTDPTLGASCSSNKAIVQLVAGDLHTCALYGDGDVACWGISDGSGNDNSQVSGTPDSNQFVEISAGTSHTCGLEADGAVLCWGDDSEGQLGGGTGVATELYASIAAGGKHTCGIRLGGSIGCWGGDSDGQVSGAPVASNFESISAGNAFTCALDDVGALTCWGNLAATSMAPTYNGPFDSISVGSDFVCALYQASGLVECWGDTNNAAVTDTFPADPLDVVSAGGEHACGVDSVGQVYCWGSDAAGQSSTSAVSTSVSLVAAGTAHTCAYTVDGDLVCWGENAAGQASPPATLVGYSAVSAGVTNSCAITLDSEVVCWGDQTFSVTNPPAGSFVEVDVGQFHACGRLASGELDCWGVSASNPTEYSNQDQSPSGTYVDMDAGYNHTCAVATSETVQCWGDDGDSKVSGRPSSGEFTRVAAGDRFSCALDNLGFVDCWGSDAQGIVSNVPLLGSHVDLVAGEAHACVLTVDKKASCWGDSTYGQTTVPAANQQYESISAGGNHTCARRANGQLDCWGNSTSGVLTVPFGVAFDVIDVGDAHACGITSDGDLSCWGENSLDQATPP